MLAQRNRTQQAARRLIVAAVSRHRIDQKYSNDNHGHRLGDEVLEQAVAVILENRRRSDSFGRYGGEVCVPGLPDGDAQNARRGVQRLREAVEKASVDPGNGNAPIRARISLGIAPLDDETPDTDAFSDNADQAVYVAKRAAPTCGVPAPAALL